MFFFHYYWGKLISYLIGLFLLYLLYQTVGFTIFVGLMLSFVTFYISRSLAGTVFLFFLFYILWSSGLLFALIKWGLLLFVLGVVLIYFLPRKERETEQSRSSHQKKLS